MFMITLVLILFIFFQHQQANRVMLDSEELPPRIKNLFDYANGTIELSEELKTVGKGRIQFGFHWYFQIDIFNFFTYKR